MLEFWVRISAINRANSSIGLISDAGPMIQYIATIDDNDRNPKELCDALDKVYTMFKVQKTLNSHSDVEKLNTKKN